MASSAATDAVGVSRGAAPATAHQRRTRASVHADRAGRLEFVASALTRSARR